jgi:hypothetical protein
VNEHKRARLIAMTFRTRLILPGEGEPTRRLENVHAVWIVAANAIEISLNDRVMMWKPKLSVGLLMTGETCVGFFP